MLKKCFIPACGNTSENSDKLFILIPLQHDRRIAWFKSARLQFVPKGSRVYCCEDHFNLEQDVENWMAFKTIGQKIKMRPDVIPHKFITSPKPPSGLQSQLTSSARKRRIDFLERLHAGAPKRRLTFDTPGSSVDVQDCQPSPSGSVTEMTSEVLSTSSVYYEVPKYESKTTQTDANIVHNKKIQTEVTVFLNIQPELSDTSESNQSSGSRYTATSSRGSTSTVWSIDVTSSLNVYRKTHIDMIEKKSRFYLGLPADTYFVVHKLVQATNMKYRDVLICLKKIRLGDVNVRLADDFGVSAPYISKVFNKGVPTLASLFKQFIIWHDAKYIEIHLPIPFRYRYRKVQAIIDCFEIEIEVPSNPLKQSLTWSDYKKCNTIKYMVSATPHGIINFISPGFGGRTTDKTIITESGYLNVIPEGCEIMADRGFKQIGDILATKRCTLVRPPSVSAGELPHKEMVRECRRIAALRIHIERAIRRLREFTVLKRHACIDKQLMHLYDCIVIIAAGIVNLQGALIK